MGNLNYYVSVGQSHKFGSTILVVLVCPLTAAFISIVMLFCFQNWINLHPNQWYIMLEDLIGNRHSNFKKRSSIAYSWIVDPFCLDSSVSVTIFSHLTLMCFVWCSVTHSHTQSWENLNYFFVSHFDSLLLNWNITQPTMYWSIKQFFFCPP